MLLNERGSVGVVWIRVVQDRVSEQVIVNTVIKLRILQKVGNFLAN